MSELLKATLQEVSSDSSQKAIGDPVPVQFNPSSLKLKLQNKTDGGRSRGRQRRQHNGASSTVLSMDLVFDTADEGTDETPVSVRTKTSIVEKYVLPKEDTSDAPPRLQFQWDELIIAGIVESVDIDFDHFASNGAPLRAKVSLSIKEQEPKYTYVEGAAGAAAKDSSNASTAGSGGGNDSQPGTGTNTDNNTDNSDRSAPALEGESPSDFLARQGLDPSAWRGLGVDLSAGLSLQAGVEVGFSAGLSASVGVGVSLGVHAQASVSLEASLGVSASAVFSGTAAANVNASASASASASAGGSSSSVAGVSSSTTVNGDAAGLALSAAGGIQSAMETVKITETAAASSSAKASFGLSGGSVSGAVMSNTASSASAGSANTVSTTASASSTTVSQTPRQSPTSLSSQGESASDSTTATTSVSLPKADPRSASYGYGVPLRPVYPTALVQQDTVVCKSTATTKRSDGGPQFRKQKTTPAWEALPKRDSARKIADAAQASRRKKPFNSGSCGC